MRSRSEAAVIAGAASSFQLSSFPARNAKVSPIPMTTASRMPISEISFLFSRIRLLNIRLKDIRDWGERFDFMTIDEQRAVLNQLIERIDSQPCS